MAGYVLDTSAVMAALYQESGAEQVRELFDGPDFLYMPFMSLMEVRYKLIRERPDFVDSMMAVIDEWPVQVVESDYTWRESSAQVKSGGGLSLADAWIAALALIRNATLVHKDPEFDKLNGLEHLRLPYRARHT